MPPAELWVQYSLIGILFLSTTITAGAFYKLWKDQTGWIDRQEAARLAEREKQDTAREIEREKQREWEATQAKQRDGQWQNFLQTMQAQWLQNDARSNEVLAQLVDKINELNISVNNHDTWARASSNSAPRNKKVG
jgi:hypothetical protein